MNKISTKYIMCQNVPTMHITHVYQPCISTSYKNISSMKCINHMLPSTCHPCASINMPTMCICQYVNHVHLPICQTCASTNILEVYQSFINYRSSYDSSIMYNMTNDMSQYVVQPYAKCMHHDIQQVCFQ
jgi:hypothetical protein